MSRTVGSLPRARCVAVAVAAIGLAAVPAAAAKKQKPKPWPPLKAPGKLFVHFGEEHINDADGPTLLPKVVRESARYRPKLVTMSGDKADDGETAQLDLWADVMKHYDRRGIPWFAAVGNHDRKAPPGLPGGVSVVADFAPYKQFFASRPYPMGDAPGYDDRKITPDRRASNDPSGASSSYFVDYGDVARWVFLDNSCWSLILCDPLQNPSGQNLGGSESQFNFLRRVGRAASEQGKLVFVVMHMPTQDPGDQLYREPTAVLHTMGKTAAGIADNLLFEQTARDAGVDGVFVAHIKGQFLYRGAGGIPYFIDGGAGGELYTTGPVGVDHGYWHGFRLLRVRGDQFRTDAVPIFVNGGIRIEGPTELERGDRATFEAFGRQPVFNDPAKVEALELRDPAPTPRPGGGAMTWVGDLAPWAGPLLAALAFAFVAGTSSSARRRLAVPALAGAGALGLVGVSAAQQSEPTSTPVSSLPNPARIWTTGKPKVLKPVASPSDDSRRNKRTQTADGRFEAVCPGRARLRITSGFESATHRLVVGSEPGPIVRRLKPGAKALQAGDKRTVARLRLKQPAQVLARVKRDGRKVATLIKGCRAKTGKLKIRWNGRAGRRHRKVDPGVYQVKLKVISDRKPRRRSFPVEVR
jgi:hypothetical protein